MEPLESDFELLYRAQVQSIYRYALALTHNPALAEELTQEAFVRLLQSRAQLKHPGSENSWLCTTVRRLYLDQLRRDGRTQELTELADDSRFEEHLADQDAALQLHRILHQLPELYKEVFSLRVFGQLSCTQIAQVFGRSENWVRVTFCRAKLKIRAQLERAERSDENGQEDQ